MKMTVTESMFIDNSSLRNSFSYEARLALFEYVEDAERDTGEEYEFDPVGLSCEWAEYTLSEALEAWGHQIDPDNEIKTMDEFAEAIETETQYMRFKDITTNEERILVLEF